MDLSVNLGVECFHRYHSPHIGMLPQTPCVRLSPVPFLVQDMVIILGPLVYGVAARAVPPIGSVRWGLLNTPG